MYKNILDAIRDKGFKYEETEKFLEIEIPRGRNIEKIKIDQAVAEFIDDQKINFLDYKFVPNYEAIWSDIHNHVECEITINWSSRQILKLLTGDPEGVWKLDDDKYSVEIKRPSFEFSLLRKSTTFITYYSYINSVRRIAGYKDTSISISVKADSIKTSGEATNIIQSIIESLCFDISCNLNTLFLPSVPVFKSKNNINNDFNPSIIKLNKKIDSEALSYYWSAESSQSYPLISFLGYYQVVEYFYSYFAENDLRNKIGNIIKEPSFNVHDYKMLNKIITVNKNFINSNKDQAKLTVTINSCVDESEFKEWFNSDIERVNYFNTVSCSKVSPIKINSKTDTALLKQAIERFYDVRCRIVHTDTNNESERNLSPRNHIESFNYDIELAKYFAQKVLICTSTGF
ncbi:hypothetical protein ABTC33_17935 [Acinetobacter baumannii]